MSELPVNPYHFGDPSATAVTATGALLTGRVPAHIERYKRHQKVDRDFAELRVSVEDQFESLRRSIGQKFRWARYENERELVVARKEAGLIVFRRWVQPKC